MTLALARPHVIIVGAGLAGPALASALAGQGIRSTILERHPTPQNIGGVILVAPNAMRVLDKQVGIEPRLRAAGCTYDAIDIYTEGSSSLNRVGGFMTTNGNVRGLTIARPVLQNLLLDRCQECDDGRITIRYSSRLARIQEDKDAVTAVLEDGTEIKGDILIGADGIGSLVRQHILGETPVQPKYSGSVSLGSVLRRDQVQLPATMQLPAFFYTRSGTIFLFAMDDDTIQWATTSPVPDRDRHTWQTYRESGQAIAQLQADWGHVTVEPIASLVRNTSNDNIRLWAPYEMPVLPRWHTARTCVLGDAAHAIPPSMGQGAAQAFEDVGVLSRLLSEYKPTSTSTSFESTFAQFEALRRPRVDMIRKMTAKAESSRGATSSNLGWYVKNTVIRGAFMMFGKGKECYMNGGEVTGYDANAIDVQV